MSVSSAIAGQGILTGPGTVDTVRTAAGTEYHVVSFLNADSSAVTLDVWVNGTAAQNQLVRALPLAAGERAVLRQKLGDGDSLRAEASQASAIVWTDEMDEMS